MTDDIARLRWPDGHSWFLDSELDCTHLVVDANGANVSICESVGARQ